MRYLECPDSYRKQNGGCLPGSGREKWGVNVQRIQMPQRKKIKILEMDAGDACPTM